MAKLPTREELIEALKKGDRKVLQNIKLGFYAGKKDTAESFKKKCEDYIAKLTEEMNTIQPRIELLKMLAEDKEFATYLNERGAIEKQAKEDAKYKKKFAKCSPVDKRKTLEYLAKELNVELK